ncbi:hypothetical protein HpEKA15_08660 [Helicobacter pylori]
MLTYYYIYDIVEPMSMEAITLRAYSKDSLKLTIKRSLGIGKTATQLTTAK